MTQALIVFIGIGCVSLGVLCAGVVLNHRLVAGRREILNSLRQVQGSFGKERMGFLAWFYILFTVIVLVGASVILAIRPPFL